MKEMYEKLERSMKSVTDQFPNGKVGYLAENILLIDFKKKDFSSAIDVASNIVHGDDLYPFKMNVYPKNNRLAFIF